MGRQRERLKETVRVEGPALQVDRKRKRGEDVKLWKPWEEVGNLGGESRSGWSAP